jgi:tetratricopeptide (TPR) repeat protein
MENNIVNLRRNKDIKNLKRASTDHSGKSAVARFVDFSVELCFYILILLSPLSLFSFAPSYEIYKTALFFFVLGLALFLWAFNGAFLKRNFVVAKSFLTLSFFLFTVVVALSALFSVDIASSLFGFYGGIANSLLVYAGMFIFYFVIASLIAEKGSGKMVNNLLKAFLLASFLVSLCAFCLYADFSFLSASQSLLFTSHPIGDSRSLAIYLLVAMLVALYGYKKFVGPDILFKALSILLVVLNILNFIFMDWGLIWLVLFFLCLLVVGINLFLVNGQKGERSDIFIIALLFISFLFTLNTVDLSGVLSGKMLLRDSSYSATVKEYLGTRDLQADPSTKNSFSGATTNSIAYQSLRAFPVLGSGVGTYYYDFAKYKPVEFNYEENWSIRFTRANSEYLDKISTLGLLGVITFIFLSVVAFALLWKNIKFSNENKFLFVAFVGLLIFQFIYTESIASKFLFAFLLVLAFARNLSGVEEMRFESEGRKREYSGNNYVFCFSENGRNETLYVLAMAMMILGGVYAYFSVQFLRADVAYLAIAGEQSVNAIDSEKLESIVATSPYKGWYESAISRIYISRLNNLLSDETNNQEDLDRIKYESDKALSHAKKAIEISPNNINFWENYSYVYKRIYELGMEGADSWSVKGFEKSISLDPNNPVLRTELGKVYSLQSDKMGDTEKVAKLRDAEKSFNDALALKMDYPDAMTGMAMVYYRLDRKEEALRKVDEASSQQNISISNALQVARVYYNLEQKEKATEILNIIININPNISDAHYILGLIYNDQKRFGDALMEFDAVLELNPGNRDVMEKIEDIEKLMQS